MKSRRFLSTLLMVGVVFIGISIYGAVITRADGDALAINETNFPDQNFRDYVKTFDTDGVPGLSEAEIKKVTTISISTSDQTKQISDCTSQCFLDTKSQILLKRCIFLCTLWVLDNSKSMLVCLH